MRRVKREDMSSQEEIEDELESQQIVTGNKRVVPSTRKKRRGMIEKRRRDKINHLLAELRRLVPAAFEKQGSAKLEKAEILQMTVDYLTTLHAKGMVESVDNSKYIPLQSINDHITSSPSNQAQLISPNVMLNQSQAQNLNLNLSHHHHHHQQNNLPQQQQQQAALQSQTNSLHNNILQNQPIDHNNHIQQQRQSLLDSSSAHVTNAPTAAAMLSVVPSPSTAVQSSAFTSAASASHHFYSNNGYTDQYPSYPNHCYFKHYVQHR